MFELCATLGEEERNEVTTKEVVDLIAQEKEEDHLYMVEAMKEDLALDEWSD